MKSFALWYKVGEEKELKSKNDLENANISEKQKIKFDLHMNFWSESLIEKGDKNKRIPFLDVGIKVYEFRKVKEFIFQCPFKLKRDEIYDLHNKIVDRNNAQIIFNTDVEIETKKGYSILNLNGKEKMLVCSVPKSDECIKGVDDDRTNIIFDLQALHRYIEKKKEDYQEIDELYIRFRIQSDTLINKVYSDWEDMDKSFQSHFSGTRILDFKINEERNLNQDDNKNYLVDGYEVALFENIHLLMMELASCDVQSFAEGKMTCREVENDLWRDYCGEDILDDRKQVLAYHWKFSEEDLNKKGDLSSVSCLAKVKYFKTGFITMIAYSFIVVGLGMCSSILFSIVDKVTGKLEIYYYHFGIALILILIGLVVNIKKK